MQVFIRNRTGFLVTRSILGLAEAGFIPGAMFTLSQWYTRDEITRRIAIFFFGMFGGSAVGPLLGAGLLRLDGKGGLSGWQWIFLGRSIPSYEIGVEEYLTLKISGGDLDYYSFISASRPSA